VDINVCIGAAKGEWATIEGKCPRMFIKDNLG